MLSSNLVTNKLSHQRKRLKMQITVKISKNQEEWINKAFKEQLKNRSGFNSKKDFINHIFTMGLEQILEDLN